MKKRILVVDDNHLFYKNFKILFEDLYTLTYCSTLTMAEATLKKKKYFDLMLIDLKLDENATEFAGLYLISEIRRIPFYNNVPVIAISKYFTNHWTKEEALKVGANRTLSKIDFNAKEWTNMIKETLTLNKIIT